jgi:hypothetical protein
VIEFYLWLFVMQDITNCPVNCDCCPHNTACPTLMSVMNTTTTVATILSTSATSSNTVVVAISTLTSPFPVNAVIGSVCGGVALVAIVCVAVGCGIRRFCANQRSAFDDDKAAAQQPTASKIHSEYGKVEISACKFVFL